MENPGITMKYENLNGERFDMLCEKIFSTPTNNKNACALNRLKKEIKRAKTEVFNTYKSDLIAKYAIKNEDGTLKRPEGSHPDAFELPQDDPKIVADFQKDQEEFGKREIVLNVAPLRPSNLVDVKLSAHEIDLLGDLFTPEEGPGLPFGMN